MATQDQEFPSTIIDILQSSQRVVILTGAGISAESGVPTFRQAQTGLWAQYEPTELATPAAFERDPGIVWEWYSWRRELISNTAPNPGHYALAEMESFYPDFTLITQNVDGFHQLAGSQKVVELHGNIFRNKCTGEGRHIQDLPQTDEEPPHCPNCGGLLRPDVVWFGESLPSNALDSAFKAVKFCQLFLSIGTSTIIEPAASLPFFALNNGATVIEINPQETPLTPLASYAVPQPAGDFLPKLVKAINS